MLKYILFLMLLPSAIYAQYTLPANPVESSYYLELIAKDSADTKDSLTGITNSFRRAPLTITGQYYNTGFQRLVIKNKYLKVYPHKTMRLSIGGFYNSAIEIKKANRLPALQNQYVQGRSNGGLQWNGPETGELFSYGPDIRTLEFDGSSYEYDLNGRLVPDGSGNGKKAVAYDNSVIRTGVSFSQLFNIQATHSVNSRTDWSTSLKLGHTNESMIIKENKNTAKNLAASVQAMINQITITGNYGYSQNKFSNSNRNGFLSRVYQDAMLTPISFDNSQGKMVNTTQRSYSPYADNPLFLLDNNGNKYTQSHHNGSIVIERRLKKFKYKLVQSVDATNENSAEGYKPGTSYFQAGIFTTRNKKDILWFIKANPTLDIKLGDNNKFRSTASLNYIFTSAQTDIQYSINPVAYKYRRTSHEASTGYSVSFREGRVNAFTEIGNKLYISTTTSKNCFFLPSVGGYVNVENLIDHRLSITVSSMLNHYNNELLLDKSQAHANLLQYAVDQSRNYFPVTEIKNFDGVMPIHHRDWSGRLTIDYNYKFSLSGEVFVRKTFNDVFPVNENGELILHNIADHRNAGVEITVHLNKDLFRNRNGASSSSRISFSNSLSFMTWQNKVMDVRDGYDFTPVAGFSDVHKAIVKGKPLGSIVGSSFIRDSKGNMIIDATGFPMVDNQLKVIGNPIPDFVIKMNNILTWKAVTLNADWEWRKGGEAWNGTQAMLDYYGRSAQTAEWRNVTNYIFPGVTANGHPNSIPVSLYDPSRPLSENRWVRNGPAGVAEEYIQETDQIRLQSLTLGYKLLFKRSIQSITLTTYINNIVLWSAYKGADPGNRLLYDQSSASGLDYFNIPALKTYGLSATIQF